MFSVKARRVIVPVIKHVKSRNSVIMSKRFVKTLCFEKVSHLSLVNEITTLCDIYLTPSRVVMDPKYPCYIKVTLYCLLSTELYY